MSRAKPEHVIIVGGGIAGIACALALAESGVRITLLETRKKLGGRATSFQDVRTGLVIDNCQHVAMGCCTNYLDFCRRLGVLDRIRWLREIYWVEAGGRVSTLRPGMMPAPGHYAMSFLGAHFLSAREKILIAMAMNRVLKTDRVQWTTRVFSEWLHEAGQGEALIRRFWEPVIVSACNLMPDRVCAASALHVFQEGFLAHRDAATVGVSAVPLVELYDPAEAAIAATGGVLKLGAGVGVIRERSVVLTSGEEMSADAVVCAVTPERACRMVDAVVKERDGRFGGMERITHSPILGVHLTFDRAVMPMHSAVLVERPTQWLFRKDEAGAHIHAVISAADAWMALDEEEITRRVLMDLHTCFPESREAKLLSSRPVKEKLATFAPTPETEASRPRTVGGSALILAGDYVRTGWPATMEGATRSGYLAAAALIGGEAERFVRPSLKPNLLVRALSPSLR